MVQSCEHLSGVFSAILRSIYYHDEKMVVRRYLLGVKTRHIVTYIHVASSGHITALSAYASAMLLCDAVGGNVFGVYHDGTTWYVAKQ